MTTQPIAPKRIKGPHRSIVMGIVLSILLMTTGVVTSARQARSSLLPVSLSFSPAAPTIVDSVTFSVDGEWQNGCTPEFSDLRIFPTDQVVRIDAISNPNDGACTQSVTPFSWKISTLFEWAGSYQVYFFVQDGPAGTPELMANTVIDVKGGLRLSPVIAVLGEPISAIVSDIATTSCVPEYYGRTLVSDLVYIEMISPDETEGCATVFTPWSISVPLSDLTPANYSVQLRVTEAGGALSSGHVVYRDQLFVFENLYRTFLPGIARNGAGE